MLQYKAGYKFVEGGVRAQVLDFPAAITCADNLPDARRLLASALVDVAEAALETGSAFSVPNPGVSDREMDVEEPIYLHLQASSEEAGSTLKADTVEVSVARNGPRVLPAPVVELPVAPRTVWEREYQAFRRLLPALLRTHGGQYVAIHGEQVVDSGDDRLALALRVLHKVGNVPIHVGRVSEEPEPVSRSGVRRDMTRSGGTS